jgi:hypothetical protein
MDRLCPVPKSRSVRFKLPEVHSVSDASAALTLLIKGLSSGKLLPEDVEALSAPIVALIKAAEVTVLEDRLTALEVADKAIAQETRYNA